MHLRFVITAANLHAYTYGLKGETDVAIFKNAITSIIIPDFSPRSGVKIAANEAEANNASAAHDDSALEQIIKALPLSSTFAGMRLAPAEFEKVRYS